MTPDFIRREIEALTSLALWTLGPGAAAYWIVRVLLAAGVAIMPEYTPNAVAWDIAETVTWLWMGLAGLWFIGVATHSEMLKK